jgi:hypothetical protein
VYRGWPAAAVDEDSPVFDGDEQEYGPLKAAAERAAEAAMPGRVLHVRAGVIVGPHENIGRLPYWLRRMRRGGDVLVPGPRGAGIQLIDARELARWMLAMAAQGGTGTFNAVAPPGWATWEELLELSRAVVNPRARLCWVDGARVPRRWRTVVGAAAVGPQTSRAPSARGSRMMDAGLDDRRPLIEAGPGLGTELRGESVDRAHDGNGGRDCDERDHATSIDHDLL